MPPHSPSLSPPPPPPPPLLGSSYSPICGSHPNGAQLTGGSYVVVEACIKTSAVAIVLLYMYYRRRVAWSFSSSSSSSSSTTTAAAAAASASSLIFPFYYSLFFATALVDILTVILSLSFGGNLPPAMAAMCWALSRLITEGLTIFLLHHGVGLATIQYSFTYAVMWALISFIAWYCVPLLREDEQTNTVGDVLALVYLTPPLLAYLSLTFAPMKHLPRRPAVLPIALLMSAVFATLVLREALLIAQSFLPGPCILWTVWSLFLWACFPFVVYHALVIDSQWWQGLYHDPRGWAGNLNTPLLEIWGDGLLEAPASELARLMYQLETVPTAPSTPTHTDGLAAAAGDDGFGVGKNAAGATTTTHTHTLTGGGLLDHTPETHLEAGTPRALFSLTHTHTHSQQERVPIIPFGQLRLRTDLRYRSGSNSRVYIAEYKGVNNVVAVKMLFAMELDRAILRDFVQEARVLYSLRRHENVLMCLGVAIMPPAACLVTEYCGFGSLFEFLNGVKEQGEKRRRRRAGREEGGYEGEEMGTFSRDGREEEEEGGEGGGEGVAALLHAEQREVSVSGEEKKRDEGSGGGGGGHDNDPPLPTELPYALRLQLMVDCAAGLCHLHAHGFVHGDIKSLNFLVTAELRVKLGDVGECRRAGATPTGGGPVHPSTINWSPPEVLGLQAMYYHPSMDIYSLGLVLHEILTLEVPFHREPFVSLGHQGLIQHILAGGRPSLVGVGEEGGGKRARDGVQGSSVGRMVIVPELQVLLQRCWQVEAAARPSAVEIHEVLVGLLEKEKGGGRGVGGEEMAVGVEAPVGV